MGNCTASQRAVESWADDGEWGEEEASSSSEGEHHHHHHHDERREDHHDSEVTIRITKRQLHELMEKNGSGHGGLPLPGFGSGRRSAEQLLADIMYSGEVHHRNHHREEHWHWKPALQSIPEAVESS
ncbi:unnamed protein product [Miscanthus lutarioriparius]|uniref:Uncharacterized protein n=1 Tax=Miscanthus lutarioriparius TaxID=422564 RepID=A0A811SFG0_9POAL|nr:unnamed protein product [Miscanthus lutarioriparius]CAD6341906.1 unnamed protein product [Miscanthus lutarioriparius]